MTLAALLLLVAPPFQDGVSAARDWRAAHGPAIVRDFADLLRLENVSSDRAGVRRNAQAIAERFTARGVRVSVEELEGANPIVLGRLQVEGAARTLGVYVHYDGQPVVPERWSDPPFEPTLRTAAIEAGGERRALPEDGEAIDPEWRLYARASGDDKAPLVALLAALDALDAAGLSPRSNLVLLFEGEEEAGSPNLGRYLERYRERLQADLWLICDGPLHQSRRPQLVFGVRGVTSLELTVYGAARNLHSGHYGNWAPNPGMMLARLLASMRDEHGEVVIEGFHDSARPLGEAERQALEAVPRVDADLRRELALARTEGRGQPRLEERLLLPSLNVRGLSSGAVGAAARNVIPNRATAAIDVRLVEGNRPAAMLDLVEAHIRAQGYHIVRDEPGDELRRRHPRLARVVRGGGYPAVRTPLDEPAAMPVRAAVEAAAGEAPILMPSLGGSLPLYLFREHLGAPLVILPIANHDNNQHAPDENLRLANLWYGIDLFAALLTQG